MPHKFNTHVTFEIQEMIGEYRLVEKSPDFYCDEVALACGPTESEKSLQASSSRFADTLQSDYKNRFGEQSDTFSKLNSRLEQIASGKQGQGFSAEELAARTGDITAQAAATGRNVLQSVRNSRAGQQFDGASDSSGLARSSAINAELVGSAGALAENQKAAGLRSLTSENYQVGRENVARTAGGLETLAGLENPEGYGSEAISSNAESFKQADAIQKAQAAKEKAIASGIASAAMSAATFGAGGITNLGGGGWDLSAFTKGGLGALSGQ